MAQLCRDYDEFVSQQAEVVVIGPDDAQAFQDHWQQEEIPYIGLPDPEHAVLKLYGQEVKLFKFGRMPAQVIIDKDGIARYVHYGHSMSDIPENEDILAILAELNDKEDAPDLSDSGKKSIVPATESAETEAHDETEHFSGAN